MFKMLLQFLNVKGFAHLLFSSSHPPRLHALPIYTSHPTTTFPFVFLRCTTEVFVFGFDFIGKETNYEIQCHHF